MLRKRAARLPSGEVAYIREICEKAAEAAITGTLKRFAEQVAPMHLQAHHWKRQIAIRRGALPLRIQKVGDTVVDDLDRPLENAEALLEIACERVNHKRGEPASVRDAIEAVKAVSLARIARVVEWNEGGRTQAPAVDSYFAGPTTS